MSFYPIHFDEQGNEREPTSEEKASDEKELQELKGKMYLHALAVSSDTGENFIERMKQCAFRSEFFDRNDRAAAQRAASDMMVMIGYSMGEQAKDWDFSGFPLLGDEK